ncbi:MAG: hypothetical protein ACOH2I_11515 [Pseudomonas sp.]
MEILHTFKPEVLAARIANQVLFYQTKDTDSQGLGALVLVSESNPAVFLQTVVQSAMNGLVLDTNKHMMFSPSTSHYSCYFQKTAEEVAADLAVISTQLEVAYRAELKELYLAHVESIVQETVARVERAEARKADTARTKLLEQARADAIKALGQFE